MVIITGLIDPAAGDIGFMGFAVTGATTQAAADDRALIREHGSSSGTGYVQASTVVIITNLTAGTNTFTLQYKQSGGSSAFANRTISVIPLN